MTNRPSWRKIEAALVTTLEEWGFEIEETGGEKFITVFDADEKELDVCLRTFATELEKRL